MSVINGNVSGVDVVTFGTDKTWDATAQDTTAAQTVLCPGVRVGDVVTVTKPTEQAGLGVVGVRASDTDVLTIVFTNPTGSGITSTAEEEWIARVVRAPLPHDDKLTF